MTQRIARVLVAALLVSVASATAVVDRSLAAMLERADIVVYGQVDEVTAQRTTEGEIRTRVVIAVDRDLASPGDPRDDVTLSFLGGRTAAGEATVVEGIPAFTEGERVLVLAYEGASTAEAAELASPIVGVWQGVWRLGPSGLGDMRGRLLTPSPQGLLADGAGGDLEDVLDALAAWQAGEVEIPADPPPAGPAADDADAPAPGPATPEADGEDAPAPDTGASAEGDGASAADAPAIDDAPAADERPRETETGAGAAPAPDGETGPGEGPDATTAEDRPAPDGALDDATAGGNVRLRPPDSDALRRTIEEAARAWRDAGADVQVTFDDAAPDRLALGDPDVLGPDALSLGVRRAGAEGVDVLVHPDAATRVAVAALELGRIVGATPTDRGLLAGRLAPGEDPRPTAADAAALRRARDRRPGDLDGDGDVDVYDLARVAEAFGSTGPRLAADLDDSGSVDRADLELLRESYDFLPPAADPPAGRRGTSD